MIIVFLSSFTNNGIVQYSFNGNQSVKTLPYSGLTISGGGSKTLTGDISVSGELNIQGGALVTGVNKVTLSSSATMTEASGSTIIGKVNTTRNATQGVNNNFGGIGIEINALGNTPGDIYVERVTDTTITAYGNSSIKRYFNISPALNNSLNANLIFHYDESELNGIPETNLKLFRALNLTSAWNYMNGAVNHENNTISLTSINDFSFWTAADIDSPLSIKTLNLTTLIEGFYNGSTMVSDTVTVELRNSALPYSLVEQTNVVLNPSGNAAPKFYIVQDATSYYIVVKHRNSVETWSATGFSFSGGLLSYDFTTSANKAYGDNMVLVGSKWCMYSGDINQDGIVESKDLHAVDADAFNYQKRICQHRFKW